jgi:hypothetical protein
MKKIITLLFSLGAFTISFAQYDHQGNNDDKNYRTENKRDDQYARSSNGDRYYDRDDRDRRHFDKGNYNSAKARDFQVEKINRDFNFRIQAIQSDRYLRRREKKAAIRNAEIERSRQIQMVNERFHYDNNRNWNR